MITIHKKIVCVNFRIKKGKVVTTIEKSKKIFIIALGFGLATYLIMSGIAILDQESSSQEKNTHKVRENG